MDEVEGEHALAFLDNEHIALARASYTGDQLDCWWIEVFRIPPTIGETGPRVRFWLPEFVQWISCIEFTLRCEPNGPTIDPPSRDGSTPFASHPSHNLLELFIHCRDGHMTNWPFRVYMLTSKLLSLYEGALRDSPGLTGVTMEDWLPESTRWFPHVYTNPLVCHIHGQRFLTVSANRMQLSILDFNPCLLARSQSEESGTPGPTGSVEEVFVTESSVHAIPSVFSGVFESALPYREIRLPFSLTTLPSPEECGGLMLDSERIIVVGVSSMGRIQTIGVSSLKRSHRRSTVTLFNVQS